MQVLDVGGIARPELGRWLLEMPALRRVVVPRGALPLGLLRRLQNGGGRQGRAVEVAEVEGPMGLGGLDGSEGSCGRPGALGSMLAAVMRLLRRRTPS